MGFFGRLGRKLFPTTYAVPVTKITQSALRLIAESARASHPHEFGGTLRAQGDTITEILLLPGTVSGETHAILHIHMLPIDWTVRGTVHSHPGGNPRPSGADLDLFRRFGTVHVIVAEPYTTRTWRAYDGYGRPIALDVVPG